MPLSVNVGGTWRHTRAAAKISGVWKDMPQAYVNVGGAWKNLYSFTWETGNWSACSAECGGGTQTRTARCRRSDGQYYGDAVCVSFAGAKPSLTQPCNTQACETTEYPESSGVRAKVYAYGKRVSGSCKLCRYTFAWGNCFAVDESFWGSPRDISTLPDSVAAKFSCAGGCTYYRGENILPFTYDDMYEGTEEECYGEWAIDRRVCPA